MYEDSSVKCLLMIWIIIFIVLGVVEEDTKWDWTSQELVWHELKVRDCTPLLFLIFKMLLLLL